MGSLNSTISNANVHQVHHLWVTVYLLKHSFPIFSSQTSCKGSKNRSVKHAKKFLRDLFFNFLCFFFYFHVFFLFYWFLFYFILFFWLTIDFFLDFFFYSFSIVYVIFLVLYLPLGKNDSSDSLKISNYITFNTGRQWFLKWK